MRDNLKCRIYDVLDFDKTDDYLEWAVSFFLIALIFLNVVVVIIETVEEIAIQYGQWFLAIEVLSLGVFSVEYGLRAWCCTCDAKYSQQKGRLLYLVTPLALVDLIAILPTIITTSLSLVLPIAAIDLIFLRVLRLFRVFRLFKLGRYNDALSTVKTVLSNKRGELFVAFFIVSIVLVLISCLMYYAEHDAQPTAFSNIPETLWWALLTLSTIGYGDMYPVTLPGRILEVFIAVLGITLFALPAGILGSAFYEEVKKRRIETSAKQEILSVSSPAAVNEIISKAAALKDEGKLTDAEYEEIKKRLLQ